MSKLVIMIWILTIMVVLAACTNTTSENYKTLSIDELATILAEEPETYTIINVHIPYAGEIEGTDANIPFNDLNALTAALPDKDAPIIIYCRSGSMSQQATETLLEWGYTQIYDIPGGMNAWQSSGRQLVSKQ